MGRAAGVWGAGKEGWLRKMGGIFPVSVAVLAECSPRFLLLFIFSLAGKEAVQ